MQEVNYIGLGASAGGLSALQEILSNIPVPSHSIYIVVQHLGSDRKSMLSEILAKSTSLDVIDAQEGTELLVGKVYVIAPNMMLAQNRNLQLLVVPAKSKTAPQPSIDTIFTFLAQYGGAKTIGILLSGSGHDGVKGLRAISDVDGITLVQSPKEAEFKSMPQSAIDAKAVHEILTLKGIAKIVTELDSTSDDETALAAIRVLLINHNGFDLQKYKENTVLRRIHKRMLLLQIDTLKSYTKYIIKNHKELQLLYEDILIGVTSFFRDKEAFEVLSEKVSHLVQKKQNKKELRVWVTACSTGEEAYSIAIMLSELVEKSAKDLSINIFASDIDDVSLAKARQGVYTQLELKNIDRGLRDKYFVQKNDNFEVNQNLRDLIVFTHHDLLNEPPFIKMDLITCRNALIYFTHPTQKEIFTMFHYALNTHGLLFLGISEALPHSMNYFTLLNTKWKIYEKEPSITPPKLAPRFYKMLTTASAPENAVDILKKSSAPSIEAYLTESMFKLFIPSCIIINRHDDMIYTKGEIPYLEFSEGFASLNIFKNLHPDLRLELCYTLEQSRKKNLNVSSKFVELQDTSDKTVFVRVIATPFSYPNNDALSLLYFQEYSIDEIIFNAQRSNFPKESDLVSSLQTQVSQMKEQLHTLQYELDNSNENMQMINEELQSSNEELQSSNEELETSNEELQATNEELNETYHHIDALKQQYSNILESSLDGIIGLDLEERHTFSNSQAEQMLGYKSHELLGKIGHSIWHHTKADGTVFDKSKCPILHVIKTGEPIRGEDLYWRKDGSSFEVQYASAPIMKNSKITGTVLFFHDISKEKALERKIKHEQSLIKHYFDTTEALVVVINTKGNIELLNRKGATLLETDAEMMVGKNWFKHFIDKSIQKEVLAVFEAVIASNVNTITPYTNEIVTTTGEKKLLYWTNTPLFDENNQSIGIIATGIDITEENELKRKLHEKEEMMIAQSRQAAMGDIISMIAHQWRQPISIISMEANSLQADLELGNDIDTESLGKLAKNLSHQTQHLSKTIDDFRNFFKPNKEVQTVSLDEIIESVKTLILKSLENNNIVFELDMQKDYEIISYKNELVQVLVNLILNARDAIKEANITDGKIVIRVLKKEEDLLIEVSDNGIGIPKELLNTLGEPYVSSKGKNGTGLGLYMSKVIVSKHLRGTLEWENREVGACFNLIIPFKVSKS